MRNIIGGTLLLLFGLSHVVVGIGWPDNPSLGPIIGGGIAALGIYFLRKGVIERRAGGDASP